MEGKKFFRAEEAARFAATLADRWQTEEGEVWDADTLLGVAGVADSEAPLDEDDPETCYLVDSQGAIGLTGDDGGTVSWWVRPAGPPAPSAAPVCPRCGAEIREKWRFCHQCGKKLR